MDSVRSEAYVVQPSVIQELEPVREAAREKPVVQDVEELEKRHRRVVLLGRIAVGILILVCWEVFTRIGLMDPYFWSSPSVILKTGWVAATEGSLIGDVLYTSGSTVIGFVLGTLAGSLIGLSYWWSRKYAEISEPFLVLLNAMPKLALAPVLVILFGIGFYSKVALAIAMTLIVAALSAYSGVKSVDPDMEKLMYSLGAKKRQVFTKVVIPWSMPWIINSLRINIALALAGAIVGEFISSREGVGRMILYAGTLLDIDLVWVGVVVLSILSMVMYGGVVLLEKQLSKKFPK
ncbi:ABC transporter permease [Cohnella candidum]|uniref:ABC transporter permease n=1 Tax=Cohnella candidum TaxID=2674991 RepID=A0A3G3K3V9_9BACL|nr:ABC transporter permease [Cohnella candidum]AYQ75173.1 ABC transporter permease [Cohnella candidum]